MTGEDNRLLVPVCRLLVSCAEGSDSACCQVLQDVIPNLIGLYNKSSVVSIQGIANITNCQVLQDVTPNLIGL